MKVFVGVLVTIVILLLALTPLMGWVGVQLFAAIDTMGGLLSNAGLSDGQRAFRGGVLVGGSMSAYALLRVAYLDRSANYLGAGALVGMGFFTLFILSGYPEVRRSPTAEASAATAANERASRPRWHSRTSYERDVRNRVEDIARAAARGEHKRSQALLDELMTWPARRPPDSDRLDSAVRVNPQRGAPEISAAEETLAQRNQREIRALDRSWRASSSAHRVGMRLLMLRVMNLSLAMADADSQADPTLDAQLAGVIALHQQMLAYEPGLPELWRSYAAVIVDTDEELSLGALVVVAWLGDRTQPPAPSPGSVDVVRGMFAPALGLFETMSLDSSARRWHIIQARARDLIAGGYWRSRAGREMGLSEQAMPVAGRLVEGAGLKMSDGPRLPAAIATSLQGEVRVDLTAAGFTAQGERSGIQVHRQGVTVLTSLTLVVDVAHDGALTSVLVERSSGDASLDQAARLGAYTWVNVAKVPSAGERRRIEVQFVPPPTGSGQVAGTGGD